MTGRPFAIDDPFPRVLCAATGHISRTKHVPVCNTFERGSIYCCQVCQTAPAKDPARVHRFFLDYQTSGCTAKRIGGRKNNEGLYPRGNSFVHGGDGLTCSFWNPPSSSESIRRWNVEVSTIHDSVRGIPHGGHPPRNGANAASCECAQVLRQVKGTQLALSRLPPRHLPRYDFVSATMFPTAGAH